MNRRVLIFIALSAALIGSWSVRGDDGTSKNESRRERALAEWKKRMMKSVGKKVTVTGTFEMGKWRDFILTDEGGQVWVGKLRRVGKEPPSDSEDTQYTVTGKLEFNEKVVAPRGISGIPEHFFIPEGEVSVIEDPVESK